MMNKLKELLNKLPFKTSPYVLLVAVLILVIILSLAGRRSQEATFDAFMDAYIAGDAEAIVKLMPKEYISSLMDSGEINNKKDLINGIQGMLDYQWENYSADERKTFDYEIAYRFETAKGDSNMDIINLRTAFGDRAKKVKDICIIGFDPVIQAEWVDGETYKEDLARKDVSLVKIGQSWYVTDFANLANWI